MTVARFGGARGTNGVIDASSGIRPRKPIDPTERIHRAGSFQPHRDSRGGMVVNTNCSTIARFTLSSSVTDELGVICISTSLANVASRPIRPGDSDPFDHPPHVAFRAGDYEHPR